MKKFLAVLLSLSFILPLPAFGADQADILQKMEALSKELDRLKQQMQEMQKKETAKEERITVVEKKAEEAAGPSWLEIGGDYRFRLDSLKGKTHAATTFYSAWDDPLDVKNGSLLTNRFGLNLKAKATEDIQVKARLLMYKVWGHENTLPAVGNPGFVADKTTAFDGNAGHVPTDNLLRVDQAYATWSNVFGAPAWFSIGRRPSTGGIPGNIRQNLEKVGTAGVPSLLVDYAFDGLTLGYAPDIDNLPGAYAKLCYGKGFDSGYRTVNNSLNDVQMVGFDVVPYDTDNLHVELNWNHGSSIFIFPENTTKTWTGTKLGDLTFDNKNIGDLDWYGATVTGKIDKIGPGDLNLFVSGAISKSSPNNKYLANSTTEGAGLKYGLLWDHKEGKKDRTGNAIYLGARYDIRSTGTKIGAEYNRGSKNWIAFVPASDDMWTGKLGTRGNVYEVYLIQHLNKKPIAKRGDAFFRLGYQHYDFQYTGSNNWVGAPHKIDDLTKSDAVYQFFPVLKKATDIYLTFDVIF